jgi:two-component system, LytTR family, response regulator
MHSLPLNHLHMLDGNVPEQVRQVLFEQLYPEEGSLWIDVLPDQSGDAKTGGFLGAQFIPIDPHRNEGRLRLQWLGNETPGQPLPAWEFPWMNGLDACSLARFREILSWASAQAARKDNDSLWYSRCREEFITFPIHSGKEISIPVREILYIQAERDMCRVYYGHGGEVSEKRVDLSIGRCAELLDGFGFLRIHRTFVVNLGCVQHCEEGPFRAVVLCNQTSLPVARRRYPEVLARLRAVGDNAYRSHGGPEGISIT